MTTSEIIAVINLLLDATPWIVLVIFIIYILKNPEKVEKWASIISKVFSFLSLKIEKSHISKDIQYRINGFNRDMNKECKDLIPYKTEINFINPANFKSECVEHDGDKLIVVMKNRKNQDENFVKAAILSTEHTLIPNSRPYVETELMNSIDLQFIKNLIQSSNKNKLSYFINNYFAPELSQNSNLEKKIQILEKLTEQGIFTRILLNELKEYGAAFFPKLGDKSNFEDTKCFFKELEALANKEHQVDVNLKYSCNRIKVGVVLVGRPNIVYNRQTINIDPYKHRIFKLEEDGMKTVYILAWSINIIAVDLLVRNLELMPNRFEKDYQSNYKVNLPNNKKLDAICVRFQILNNH